MGPGFPIQTWDQLVNGPELLKSRYKMRQFPSSPRRPSSTIHSNIITTSSSPAILYYLLFVPCPISLSLS
ncbi:hypothetical protein IF1G_08641 [Cordyceps javanica]|uniref:Uncharacterized protein n=1 Tax=Cordyceps javanica TaxID=43265 RepID=A0A545UTB6_9HYPO|nr:hypothetical protein IF1G_08641 [Cordyceps javanica]